MSESFFIGVARANPTPAHSEFQDRIRRFLFFHDAAPQGHASATIAARSFGLLPLRESLPDLFYELTQHYGELLDLALEQRLYKVNHQLSESLRALGEQLGFLKAGPRDVVQIHHTALEIKAAQVTPSKAQAYLEEGRLLVLELMGYVASYYRNQALNQAREDR
jgi:hypothetical protein